MIVMKNNNYKSSKGILPSKKMLCTASLLISKEIEKYIQKKENQLVDKLQQAGFLSTKLTVRQADKLEEELTNILQSHNEEFISLLKKYQKQGKTLEDVLNALPNFNQSRATAVKSAINTAVYNNLTEMIPKVANKYLKNIDGELEIKQMTQTTTNWIKLWSSELADIMRINTEDILRNTLIDGINGGIGIDEISRNMVDNGALKTRIRARTTAVTEVLTANRVASNEAIIQSPETDRKQWKHSGSYRIAPRENHIKMNGQVVLKTQPFKMIGADGKTYYPMIPGDTSLPPAERINCHCIVSPVLDDSVFNMPLEERQALQQKCIQEYDEFNGLNTGNSLDNSQESGIMNSEREDSPRKNKTSSDAVDWSVIQSDEYSRKFAKLSNDKKVCSSIETRAKWALNNRDGFNTEEIYAVNLTDGSEIARVTNQHNKLGVKRTPQFISKINEIDNKGQNILLLHNHPNGFPPSISDINLLFESNNVSGITVGHNGSIYYYTKPKMKINPIDYQTMIRHYMDQYSNLEEADCIEYSLFSLQEKFGFIIKKL